MRTTTTVLGGRWRLGEVLGRGAVADVFAADDLATGRSVAVEVLRSADAEAMGRFDREVEVLGTIDHPRIVRLLASGDDGPGGRYLVLERLPGGSLAQRLTSGPLDADEVVTLAVDLAEALAHAHAHGARPPRSQARQRAARRRRPGQALDFGIAQLVGAEALTATGCGVGTPAYVAPEQLRGDEVGPAADVYALGLVLLEAATGCRAFPGDGLAAASLGWTGAGGAGRAPDGLGRGAVAHGRHRSRRSSRRLGRGRPAGPTGGRRHRVVPGCRHRHGGPARRRPEDRGAVHPGAPPPSPLVAGGRRRRPRRAWWRRGPSLATRSRRRPRRRRPPPPVVVSATSTTTAPPPTTEVRTPAGPGNGNGNGNSGAGATGRALTAIPTAPRGQVRRWGDGGRVGGSGAPGRAGQFWLTAVTVSANLIGAAVVVVLIAWVVPTPADTELPPIDLVLVPAYILGRVGGRRRVGTRRLLPRLDWVRTGELPDREQQRIALRAPVDILVVEVVLWGAAVVLFTVVNGIGDPALILPVAFTVGGGATSTCATAYLLCERALRPIAALALSQGPPGPAARARRGGPVGAGVAARLGGAGGRTRLGGGVRAGPGRRVGRPAGRDDPRPRRASPSSSGRSRRCSPPGRRRRRSAPSGGPWPARAGGRPAPSARRCSTAREVGLSAGRLQPHGRGLEERERIRDLFGRHVGDSVARSAIAGHVELGGEVRDVGVLFVDIVRVHAPSPPPPIPARW